MLSLKNNLFSKKSLIIVVSILFVLALFSDAQAVPVFEDGLNIVGPNTINFGENFGTIYAATSTKISETGFWGISTSNDFVVGTNNLERLRVGASGNITFGNSIGKIIISTSTTYVGIGTTNPQKQLHIKGPAASGGAIRYERGAGASFWETGIDATSNYFFSAGASNKVMIAYLGNVGIGTSSLASYKLNVDGVVNATGFTINGVAIGGGGGGQWTSNGSSIYYNAGSVGLGIINPTYKLHLFDSSSGPIMGLSGLTTNYRGLTIKDTAGSEKWFYGANDFNNFVIRRGGTSDDLTIDYTGNVGIGLTNPNYKLDVNGTINASAILIDGSPIVSGSSQWTNNGDDIYYNTGYIGLGTMTPNSLLHLFKTTGANAELDIQSVAGANKHWGIYQDRASGSLRFWNNTPAIEKNILTILESGNIGIGTTSPSQALTVIGRIKSSVLSGTNDRCLYADAQGNITAAAANCGVGGGGGIVSLNTLTTGTQVFAIGNSGNDFNIDSVGDTHTFNLPTASATARGLLSSTDWATFNDKLSSQWTNNGNDIYYNNGKIGVGLTNPNRQLHIYDTSVNPEIDLQGVTGVDKHWGIYNHRDDNSLHFWGGESWLTILRNGNIGIGTSSPSEILSVNGRLFLGNSSAPSPTSNRLYSVSGDLYWDGLKLNNTSSGSMAKYATSTTVAENPNQGGYSGVNAKCNAVLAGSHICTTEEILYTISSGQGSSIPTPSNFWISNGPPGYTVNANDCQGYRSSLHAEYGSVWWKTVVGQDGFGSLDYCDRTHKFACCK